MRGSKRNQTTLSFIEPVNLSIGGEERDVLFVLWWRCRVRPRRAIGDCKS